MRTRKCKYCFALEKSISVLVVACPCALGLAVPSVLATTLNLAFNSGILIKKIGSINQLSKIKAIIIEKIEYLLHINYTIS